MEQVQGTLLAGLVGTSKSSTKIYFTMQNIIITTVSFSSEFELLAGFHAVDGLFAASDTS